MMNIRKHAIENRIRYTVGQHNFAESDNRQ